MEKNIEKSKINTRPRSNAVTEIVSKDEVLQDLANKKTRQRSNAISSEHSPLKTPPESSPVDNANNEAPVSGETELEEDINSNALEILTKESSIGDEEDEDDLSEAFSLLFGKDDVDVEVSTEVEDSELVRKLKEDRVGEGNYEAKYRELFKLMVDNLHLKPGTRAEEKKKAERKSGNRQRQIADLGKSFRHGESQVIAEFNNWVDQVYNSSKSLQFELDKFRNIHYDDADYWKRKNYRSRKGVNYTGSNLTEEDNAKLETEFMEDLFIREIAGKEERGSGKESTSDVLGDLALKVYGHWAIMKFHIDKEEEFGEKITRDKTEEHFDLAKRAIGELEAEVARQSIFFEEGEVPPQVAQLGIMVNQLAVDLSAF